MKKLLLFFVLYSCTLANAQITDTLKVMSYNLLNFPQESPGRIADLKVIVQEALPDIFMICELTAGTGATGILNNALNQDGITHYAQATYVPSTGTENMLFYNDSKLELKEQNVITTVLRNINEYVLYYESSDLATTLDTTFFYVYVCHLKASQGFESQRDDEASSMKQYMATRPGIENVLLGGDFNLYGSAEPAWSTILNGSGVTLVDPINTPGAWHIDWGFQDIHTQSTRTVSFDFGASGGMDDRFDFIFISPDLNSWENQAQYIPGSYLAYGQDGNHFNAALTDAPANTILPAGVIQALYNMSDHLPVYMEVEVQSAFNGVSEADSGIKAFYNSQDELIQFSFEQIGFQMGSIKVYDLSGKLALSANQLNDQNTLDVSSLDQGLYLLSSVGQGFSMKFVK